jgi:hypothetical protein
VYTSRPDTETEDDGDVDMDRAGGSEASPEPEPRTHLSMQQRARRAVGIVSDGPDDAPLEVNTDAHIIINDDQGGVIGGVGVEDGIVSLETNDDFAMGAPPGAPGAINLDDGRDGRRGFGEDRRRNTAPDVTPRQVTMNLPGPTLGRAGTILAAANTIGARTGRTRAGDTNNPNATANGANFSMDVRRTTNHSHHHRDLDSGPYRDEDVLLSLQLLAYLSKYPHVRQAFYKPRATFHPASANLPGRGGAGAHSGLAPGNRGAGPSKGIGLFAPAKESHGFFRAFGGSRGKEKEREKLLAASSSSTSITSTSSASTASHLPPPTTPTTTARHTNVFSLVERFTFRPSSSETDLPNPPPKLPPEIQYWAGVIMRNACRKDESRGGIRQCANSEYTSLLF